MPRGKKGERKPGRICNLTEFAVITGFSTERIRQLRHEGLPILKDEGKRGVEIDTALAIQWLLRHQAPNVKGESGKSYDANRARKMAADADKAEMERDQIRGELVEVDTAAAIIADRMTTLRARLLNMPSKIAVSVVAAASTGKRELAMAAMQVEVTAYLDEMSRSLGRVDDDENLFSDDEK